MNEAELKVSANGEDDVIIPSGWDGESPIFAEDGSGAVLFGADEQQEETTDTTENDDSATETDDPTTVEQPESDDPSAEVKETEETLDGEPTTEEKTTRVLKLKVNHKEEKVDINAMSDEELAAHIQKSRAYDAQKEQRNKETYRKVYQEQLEAGLTEAVAKMVAQNEAGGKQYSLTDEAPEKEDVGTVPTPAAPTPTRDLNAEIEQLKILYPNFKTMPNEVSKAWAAGVPLLNAYIAYREQESAKAAATLRKENSTLKQNAASAAKAPVKGLTGGGSDKKRPEMDDYFLKGFNSDEW